MYFYLRGASEQVKNLPRLLFMRRSIYPYKNQIRLVTQSLLDTIEKVFPCAAYLKIIQFSVCINLFAFQFSLLSDILHSLSELFFSYMCIYFQRSSTFYFNRVRCILYVPTRVLFFTSTIPLLNHSCTQLKSAHG
jgi:hypothetical protein